MFRKAARYLIPAIVLLIIAAEAAFRLAGSDRVDGDNLANCVVLIPGYPSKSDGTPHAIQRFRVEAGVAVYRKYQCSRIILSGGAVSNPNVEAEVMASLAELAGVPSNKLDVERNAQSTWENIGCSKPYFKDAARVLIVSDPLHAHRAKRYACLQDSHLCSSVSAIGVTPPLTAIWWAVPLAVNEVRIKIQDFVADEIGRSQDAASDCRHGL